MNDLLYFCPSCDWQGDQPKSFSKTERLETAFQLQPGQVMPAGYCPKCESFVYPSSIHHARLRAQAPSSTDAPVHRPELPWNFSLARIGQSYIFHLQHPQGHGCEAIIEIVGGRPVINLTPWEDPAELDEDDPLLTLKPGDGEVLLWPARQTFARPIAVRPEGMKGEELMEESEWLALTSWSRH